MGIGSLTNSCGNSPAFAVCQLRMRHGLLIKCTQGSPGNKMLKYLTAPETNLNAFKYRKKSITNFSLVKT